MEALILNTKNQLLRLISTRSDNSWYQTVEEKNQLKKYMEDE